MAVQEGETDVALSDLGLSDSAVQNGGITIGNAFTTDTPSLVFTFDSNENLVSASGSGESKITLTRSTASDGTGGGWICSTTNIRTDIVPESCQ
ncbi:pilin [Chromohalobacter israelensis]|nr:pilin [Chromohalobacter israelensis]